MAIIKLKRARNSLLNVSTLPPEILGDIFRRNVNLVGDFGRLEEQSHNFLLVCRHWFEVASHTPELWTSWGNNLQDWTERHLRHPTAPLDLVLNGRQFKEGSFIYSMETALQDRAARDTIRTIHLVSGDSELLDSILSPSAPDYEEIRSSSLESLILLDESEDSSADVSDLFAYHNFPKLQRLELVNCDISSWDLLVSRTSILTTLKLDFSYTSPNPTTSQLLSILNSNPALQKISLIDYAIPDDGGDNSFTRVSLHHLKELELAGDSQDVFAVLRRLDHPKNMDRLTIDLKNCDTEDLSELIGPYLRDYIQRRGKSPNGLGLFLSSGHPIVFHVGDVDGVDFSAVGPVRMKTFMEITIHLAYRLSKEFLTELVTLDLIGYPPWEEIVYFRARGDPIRMEVYPDQWTHLRALHFEGTPLHIAFENPNNDGKILHSLQRVTLDRVAVRHGDWSPLMSFLARCSSSRNRLDTLEIIGSYSMRPGVEENIRGAVGELRIVNDNHPNPPTTPDLFTLFANPYIPPP